MLEAQLVEAKGAQARAEADAREAERKALKAQAEAELARAQAAEAASAMPVAVRHLGSNWRPRGQQPAPLHTAAALFAREVISCSPLTRRLKRSARQRRGRLRLKRS